MEQIFPFLHEDVLYKINEYARDKSLTKELCHEIFCESLSSNLLKLQIRFHWVYHIININFDNMNDFLNILRISHKTFNYNNDIISFLPEGIEGDNNRIIYYDINTVHKLQEIYKIPLGPRIKLYHYFINNIRF